MQSETQTVKNKCRQREVRWYADRLAVTPKYLSVVCNTVTGKSAQVVINDLTVQEIKRLLLQTDMSAQHIIKIITIYT